MSQIKYLQKHYDIVDLSTVVRIAKGTVKPIRKTVAITVDDGFADLWKVMPFIHKNHIPLSLFVLAQPEKADKKELGNNKKFLTIRDLKMLQKQGVTIGCHSNTHTSFATMTRDKMTKEIFDSRKILEKKLNRKIEYFAYPKGIANKHLEQAVHKAGYRAAFGITPRSIHNQSDIYNIPRLIIDQPLAQMPLQLGLNRAYFGLRRLVIALQLGAVIHTIRESGLS